MRTLVFDTETSGKWRYGVPATHPSQPHLVQLCAVLQDDAGEVLSELNLIVQPDGFEIPAEASAIHGITHAKAMSAGVRLANACFLFRDLMERADIAVAHNIEFDVNIVTRSLAEAEVPALPWHRIPQRCTMKAMTPICRLPGPRGFKWPKLIEAHVKLFGEGFDGAHDASADTHACRRIHNELVKQGVF